MSLFWTIFFAVLAALWVSNGFNKFNKERRFWKLYCKAQIANYNRLRDRAHKAGHESSETMYEREYNYWIEQSTSWLGLMDEDDYTRSMAILREP